MADDTGKEVPPQAAIARAERKLDQLHHHKIEKKGT